MRTASFVLALAAAANVSLQAPLAFAGQGVQPVPYNPSQPISGGGTTAAPLQPLPTTAPPPPLGSGGGNDVIVLKGGGMLRGRIIEIIPNDHATIALATGQNAIVEWSRIDRIEQQPGAPPPPPPPGGGVVVMPPPPPPGRAGKAWVHIESSHDLVLEGRSPSSAHSWAPVCTSPCDSEVPLDYSYRIAGEGIRASHDFTIEASPGQRVVLNVKTASKGGFVGGIVLVSISPVVILIGLVVVAVGAAQNDLSTTCSGTGVGFNCNANANAGSGTETAGWVTTLIGVAGAVIGGVLIGINSRTSISEEVIPPVAPPVGSLDHPRREDAWLRAPIWHEPSSVERSIPPAQVAPLFTHSF
jgi:hypothetical protein